MQMCGAVAKLPGLGEELEASRGHQSLSVQSVPCQACGPRGFGCQAGLWLPPERLGSSKTVAGDERLSQHAQHLFGSQQFPATTENASLAPAGAVSTKEGMKRHVAQTHQPIPASPARVPTARGQARWERPSRAPSPPKGSMAEPKPGPTSLQCPTGT